ncbi:MAG TPA: type II toxin-antitoxin system mRNA interferase toxin, RelE/StbE family [Candidatus Saccharimonadales bacterium]
MQLTYHSKFKKQYKQLRPAQRKRFAKALVLFKAEPHHPDLYNHSLAGNWKGHRSISFGGNWRAHYIPKGKNEALFVAIGTHSQLYK